MTLFEKFEGTLNEEVIERLKKLSDRNLGDAEGGIYAVFYIMLAGLIRRANSDMSTGLLVNQIRKINSANFEGEELSKILSNEKSLVEFVATGEKTLSQIFPSFKSQLLSLVVRNNSTSKEETAKYSGFVNSLIVRFLADKLNEGMTKEELMNYLKDHRDPLFENAPESLVEKMIPAMGMHELRTMKLSYARTVEEKEKKRKAESRVESPSDPANETIQEEEVTYDYEEEGTSYTKPLIIIGAIILAAALGYFIYDSREELFGGESGAETAIVEEDLIADSLAIEALQLADSVVVSEDPAITTFRNVMAANLTDANAEFDVESFSFTADSVELSNPNNPLIDSLFTEFKRNPRFQIQIKGRHAGGSSQVGIKRAFYLKRLLQQKGVDPIKIDAISSPEKVDYLRLKVVSK
ncbi:MAG: hypothetical protein NXI00_21435 [Cytophagales bacterium]|nr:hypothetical protein [Cytophagales bacterium]